MYNKSPALFAPSLREGKTAPPKRYEQTNEITRVKIKDVIEESKRIEEEHEKRMIEYRKKGEEEER